jgi:hypothetical protein
LGSVSFFSPKITEHTNTPVCEKPGQLSVLQKTARVFDGLILKVKVWNSESTGLESGK